MDQYQEETAIRRRLAEREVRMMRLAASRGDRVSIHATRDRLHAVRRAQIEATAKRLGVIMS